MEPRILTAVQLETLKSTTQLGSTGHIYLHVRVRERQWTQVTQSEPLGSWPGSGLHLTIQSRANYTLDTSVYQLPPLYPLNYCATLVKYPKLYQLCSLCHLLLTTKPGHHRKSFLPVSVRTSVFREQGYLVPSHAVHSHQG